jgi:HPr kinase/phosphorylase
MNTLLTANDLYEAQEALLKLKWLAGHQGKDRLLEAATARFPGMALVGHLNFVHPNRVQVIGSAEIAYLGRLGSREREQKVRELFACETTAVVIVAGNEGTAADLIEASSASGLPLFSTPLPSPRVIDDLQYYLTRALAARVTLHGVFMEVQSMGVFLTGQSGIGKSELALELLSRGHRLIADDACEFARVGPDVLEGHCPDMLCDFLEVRGLGILNVRAMFGETAVRRVKQLHLIVRLEELATTHQSKIDRLQAEQKTRSILDINVPEVVLFVAPGRNLAVLVEAATRAHILRLRGVNMLDQFIAKQHASMAKTGR